MIQVHILTQAVERRPIIILQRKYLKKRVNILFLSLHTKLKSKTSLFATKFLVIHNFFPNRQTQTNVILNQLSLKLIEIDLVDNLIGLNSYSPKNNQSPIGALLYKLCFVIRLLSLSRFVCNVNKYRNIKVSKQIFSISVLSER